VDRIVPAVSSVVAGLVVPIPTLLLVHTGFVPFHWPHMGRGDAAIQTTARPMIHAPARTASLEHARTITECARFILSFLSRLRCDLFCTCKTYVSAYNRRHGAGLTRRGWKR